jgi:hypothetical protein
MERYDNTRFRITAWPGERLPYPRREDLPPLRLTADGALVFDVTLDWPEQSDYHEVYLKLAQLDLRDEHAILAFAQAYGPMGACWAADEDNAGRTYNGLTAHPGFRYLVLPRLEDAEDAVYASDLPPSSEYVETIEDFRWAAYCVRDLTRAWRFASEGTRPEKWECPIWEFDDPLELDRWDFEGREHEPPRTPFSAASLLSEYLGPGLAPFHPDVLHESWMDERWTGESRQPPYRTSPPLYFVCCLELYNHIVEEATYKTCANETCGRLFIRQEGRAMHGQNRTRGVKYCSTECARAQAQRAYRRRQRAQA